MNSGIIMWSVGNRGQRMGFTISAVDIFCGIGGLTHGLIKAGIPVVAGIDSDESCRYAYETNNGALFVKEDIRNLTGSQIRSLFGRAHVKVLVGCAPCQCFSKHTQKLRKRKKDEKWKLLAQFSSLISAVLPDVVSMENVGEIRKHGVFANFVKNLEICGYWVFHTVVYCPDYGIPQNRRRLVLLASRLGEIGLVPETHPPSRYRTVRDVIGKLERIEDGVSCSKDLLHRTFRLSLINKKRIRESKPGGTWLDWDRRLRARCHKKKSGETYGAVYGRMSWDKPAPTITTQFYSFGTGRFGHPEQDRALSLREGALLQTFPKYYDFIDPDGTNSFSVLGTHIGNAVPVRLGVIIGRSISRHLKELGKRSP
jgi:DNA (cytosine-5)-methyltransferase 1